MFCDAGTPPEGLAVVKALLKSVTGYNEPGGSRFNWNTADMVELVDYLKSRYQNQLTPDDRQFIANKVIQRRSGKDVGRDKNLPAQPSHYPAFGLTEAEFNKCVQDAAKERGKPISTAWQVQIPKPVKLTV
jgi:erythromycin esterase-like protein